jgi:hypothetical protein
LWVVLVSDEAHRGHSRLYKHATTDQFGHFDLRGIAPGDYKLFSWEEVEDGAWEDPDFLKPFEEKGERVSLQEGDVKTVDIVAIKTKSSQNASIAHTLILESPLLKTSSTHSSQRIDHR